MYQLIKPIHLAVGIALLLFNLSSKAQEQDDNTSLSLGGDLTTRFYWRGMSLSASPAIQPYLEISHGAFTLGAWGSYSLAKEPYQEIDVYLSFEHNNARLTIYDYFSPTDSAEVSHQYFDWNSRGTAHSLELIYEWWDMLGSPFSVEAGLFIYGDDKDENNQAYYSAYFEPQYSFLIGDNQLKVFSGFTPAKGLYAAKPAFVNVGVAAERQVKVNDHVEFPFTLTLAVNPHSESVFMVAAIAL